MRLELKLIADVGFVGLPNAGKSTLLSRLTNARPKIAGLSLHHQAAATGHYELPGFRRLVLADIPGLIEGAHEGVGLGDAFLRHIERTRVIVHLVDLCPPEGSPSPDQAYRAIRRELEKYSSILAQRREIVVGTKMDLTDADRALEEFRAARECQVQAVSGVTGQGLRDLTEAMWRIVEQARAQEQKEMPELIDFGEEEDWLDAEEDDDGPPAGAGDLERD